MHNSSASQNTSSLSAQELARQQIRAALRERLLKLEFLAFEQIMKSLLYKSGYISVHLTGRNHKRGRTPKGGLDLAARSATELSSALTIAQLKQYRRVVSRRFVDELRGAMLRLGAEQGLLLTLSRFSPVAHRAAQAGAVAPITLIEGDEVLDLLFTYRIGVVERQGQWLLDVAYLDSLPQQAPGSEHNSLARGGNGTVAAVSSARQRQAHEPPASVTVSTATSDPSNPSSHAHPITSDPPHSSSPSASSPSAAPGGEMTWSTHLMAGLSSLWLMEALPPSHTDNIALLAGAAALGSLLPDLDAAESKIKHLSIGGLKPFFLPAQLIYRQLGHRSFLHSLSGLVFCVWIGLLLLPFTGWAVALALSLGYVSHLAMDAVTRSGIPWLYPRPQRFHLLPARLRLTTGSPEEEIVFVLLSLTTLLLLLRQGPHL